MSICRPRQGTKRDQRCHFLFWKLTASQYKNVCSSCVPWIRLGAISPRRLAFCVLVVTGSGTTLRSTVSISQIQDKRLLLRDENGLGSAAQRLAPFREKTR